MNGVIVGLLISLTLSLAGNAWLGKAYLSKRDTAVQASTNLNHATGAALTCSTSVDNIAKQSDQRAAAAAPKREAAAATAAKGNAKADVILSTAATAPGDDCKSATARANSWFKETP